MRSGRVSASWARAEHRAWVEELQHPGGPPDLGRPDPSAP
jgi:hypothetical protein